MQNELVIKPKNEVGMADLNDWGVPKISSQDIIIPKILCMQGLSVAVTEGKAQMGEFRDSISNKLIGSINAPFEAIPFYVDKVWDISLEQADGTFKWDRTEPIVEDPNNPAYNDNWKWEAEEDGLKRKNIRRFNFYFLLPSEVAEGNAMPYIFSFKSTSIKEGKKLFTQMYIRNLKSGLPPAAYKINLGGVREKNEKGVFIVPKYEVGAKATTEDLQECLAWIKTIKAGRVKIDESDVQTTTEVASEDTGDF